MKFKITVIIICVIIEQMLCNARETVGKRILTTASKLNCSKFNTDVEITRGLPFHVSLSPIFTNRTHALMDTNNIIHTLYIYKESYVPSNIFCLKNLHTLVIDGAYFNHSDLGYEMNVVPDELGNLKKLSTLYIYNTRINKMTDELSDLVGLRHLTLINCDLSFLPNLRKLTSLYNLTINYNPFKSLDGLYSITLLDLSNCQFTEIPSMTSPLSLSTLKMEHNQLHYVDNLNTYQRLVTVNFNGNKIKEVLPSISQLIYLQTLILSNNKLQELPMDAIQLGNLRTLDISNNIFLPSELQAIKEKKRATINLII